jgi:pyruvate dehydrogenase E2 component (dihydrolipoamide acetyltransferase)
MDIRVPQLGEGAEGGTVVSILVKEGDEIEKDQSIIELSSEKATAPIPSTAAGRVTKIHVKEGDEISVDDVILSIESAEKKEAGEKEKPKWEEEERPKTEEAGDKKKAKPKRKEKPEAEEGEAQEEAEKAPPKAKETAEEERQERPSVAAAPHIRKLASQLGLDLARVQGSGRGGRIEMNDLRGYIQWLQQQVAKPTQKPAGERIDFSTWGPVRTEPLSAVRKTIVRRMVESWTTIPHVTQFDEADVTALLDLKKKHDTAYREKGARLTLTSFILQALVRVLKAHPVFNASLDELAGQIVFKDYVHIGVAVDTAQGLLVPVVHDVDRKSLFDLSRDLEALASKARERKLSPEEMRGGSFTLSNQGGIGGAHFTPIIHKPEVAILGLGRAVKKPVVREEKIELRTTLPLALSYDHRVIDGARAARFITELVDALEEFREDDVKL